MAIVSHKYRFIFLKSRKTAGSSIEIALGNLCGPDDILHPTRDGAEVGIVERNNTKQTSEVKIADYARVAWSMRARRKKLIWKRIKKQAYRILPDSHTTAPQAYRAVPKPVWDEYYKFCFERNPFDRLVSFYHWRTRTEDPKPNFREFALAALSNDIARQKRYNARDFSNRQFYMMNEQVVLDKVCLYENMGEELRAVTEHLGIPWDGSLPNAKGSFRSEPTYHEYYDAELRRICEHAFTFEMELLGYTF